MSADFYIAIYCLAFANFCTIIMIHMPIIRIANYLDRQHYYSASPEYKLELREKYRKFFIADQRRFVWKGWRVRYELVNEEVMMQGRGDGEEEKCDLPSVYSLFVDWWRHRQGKPPYSERSSMMCDLSGREELRAVLEVGV